MTIEEEIRAAQRVAAAKRSLANSAKLNAEQSQRQAAEHERIAKAAEQALAELRAKKTDGQRIAEQMLSLDGESLWYHYPEEMGGGGQVWHDDTGNGDVYLRALRSLVAHHLDKAIAEAVAAEREACAKAVEADTGKTFWDSTSMARCIAFAIRNRGAR